MHQRLLSIRVRKELTDEWQTHGVEQGREYAILTDEITRAWSGMNTRQYKLLKGLKKENLHFLYHNSARIQELSQIVCEQRAFPAEISVRDST